MNGDGLVLGGRTLFVVRNAASVVVKIKLTRALRKGTVQVTVTDPTFMFPTTAASVRDRLLVVNSQFDKRAAMQPPAQPFTVSSIARP